MPSKKASKKSAAKKSGSSRVARRSAKRKSTKKRSSQGVINKAKKVVRDVVIGAVAGAAEAGSKATGIGQPTGNRKESAKAKRK